MLALTLVVVAGIGVSRLTRPSLQHPLLEGIRSTGVPFVLLGALLGPGLGVFDRPGLHILEPVVALGIGWIGAVFGARLEWRMLRRVPGRSWGIAAILAAPVMILTGVLAWSLARGIPALASAWQPVLPAALTLAGAATTSASTSGPKTARRTALFDTLVGAAAAGLAIALLHGKGAVPSVAVTLIVSGILAGLFIALTRWQRDASDAGLAVQLVAIILIGAGFSYAGRLSPFVTCALTTALIVSFSPPAVRNLVQVLVRRWEPSLYGPFLIVAGALLRPPTAWLIPAALALAVVRVAVRWVTVRFDAGDPLWEPLPYAVPAQFSVPTIKQGAAAVALAAGFDLVRADAGAVLTTVLLSVLAAEAIAALTPLTPTPRQAEVT